MLNVSYSPANLFSSFLFSGSVMCQLQILSQLQQSSLPLHFPPLDVVISTDATPTHWASYCQCPWLPLSVSGLWSTSMCRVHIAIHELQAVALMLFRLAVQIFGKVFALQLDNSTSKAYLCNQGSTVSHFSFQTCLSHIESG